MERAHRRSFQRSHTTTRPPHSADDVDSHYRRAVAAGADIVRPAYDSRTPAFPDGARQFDVRDPEGNLWTIGTYRPRITVDDR